MQNTDPVRKAPQMCAAWPMCLRSCGCRVGSIFADVVVAPAADYGTETPTELAGRARRSRELHGGGIADAFAAPYVGRAPFPGERFEGSQHRIDQRQIDRDHQEALGIQRELQRLADAGEASRRKDRAALLGIVKNYEFTADVLQLLLEVHLECARSILLSPEQHAELDAREPWSLTAEKATRVHHVAPQMLEQFAAEFREHEQKDIEFEAHCTEAA
jgi:hypothetical protein